MGQQRFNPTTPVEFYVRDANYTPGSGHDATYKKVESAINQAGDTTSAFYAEWTPIQGLAKKLGDRVLAAQAMGISDSAAVRMTYNPFVEKALAEKQVIIVKNLEKEAFLDGQPNKHNPNVYELWTGAGNDKEENQFLSFSARRYEGK